MKNYKMTNNDPQTIAHKITYRAIKNQGMIRKGKQFLLYMWLLLQIRRYTIHEERTALCLRQPEHIRGHS